MGFNARFNRPFIITDTHYRLQTEQNYKIMENKYCENFALPYSGCTFFAIATSPAPWRNVLRLFRILLEIKIIVEL